MPSAAARSPSESVFASLPAGDPIEVVEVSRRFVEDESDLKENLSVGGYRNDEGQIHLMDVVRKAEEAIVRDPGHNHAYLPALGYPATNAAALSLLLGAESAAIAEGRAFAAQSIGGTGPLRAGAELLRRRLGFTRATYSDPTWINHRDIFEMAGFERVESYKYYDVEKQGFTLSGMLESLSKLPPRSVVILHPAAHNPTGADPTKEEWAAIADAMDKGDLFPFFDCAYQGFATGDLDEDAWVVRYFEGRGFEFFVSQSFGKNMGLYGERIGFLSGVLASKDLVPNLTSQLTAIVRPMYSNPAGHGAFILDRILRDPDMMAEWQRELRSIFDRVGDMRRKLKERLEKLAPSHNWSAIAAQVGMFYYSDLTPAQGAALADRHHVYILASSGRINLGAVSDRNLNYVAAAIADVVKNVKN